MRDFTIKFAKYTTYDAPLPNSQRGKLAVSQPNFGKFEDFPAAFEWATIMVRGMREADPVNVYEIAVIEASGSTQSNTLHIGGMFDIEPDEPEDDS